MKQNNIIKEFKKGVDFFKNEKYDKAEKIFLEILNKKLYEKECLINIANIKNIKKDYIGAIKICKEIINKDKNIYSAYLNMATCFIKIDDEISAIQCYENAINNKIFNKEIFFNLANLYRKNKSIVKAIENYDEAIKLDSNYLDAINNKAISLYTINKYKEAYECYESGLKIDENNINLLMGVGILHYEFKNYIESMKYYEKVLRINIREPKAYGNLGNCFRKLKKNDDAKKCFEMSIRLDGTLPENYFNLAQINIELKQYDEAIKNLEKLKIIKPDYEFIDDTIINTKLMNAEWKNIDQEINLLKINIIENKKVSSPFGILTLLDDEEIHLKCSQIWNEKYQYNLNKNKIEKKITEKNRKIKLGMYSPDIYFHPVAIWLVEILERINKEEFEVYLFSFDNNNKDEMHYRIKKSVEYFYECDGKSDEEIIKISNEIKLDIAMDLGGFTSSNRPEIFAYRVCNKQISFLGFPASTGSKYIDYIISDNIAIPETSLKYYSEKIKYLECLYTYDTMRKINNSNIIEKNSFNIPEDSIILCCQNGIQKIQPRIFDIWMNVLNRFANTYLLLQQPGELAVRNLIKEANKRGVEEDRIIFFKREIVTSDKEYERISRYLSIYKISDLFLDTSPYNAGTTAVDALYAGLPVITIKGNSQVGRMASSALHAMGLTELITESFFEYENLICELLLDNNKLKNLKNKTMSLKKNSKLFDVNQNVKNIEAALKEIYNE